MIPLTLPAPPFTLDYRGNVVHSATVYVAADRAGRPRTRYHRARVYGYGAGRYFCADCEDVTQPNLGFCKDGLFRCGECKRWFDREWR